jgi:hypothetical protein
MVRPPPGLGAVIVLPMPSGEPFGVQAVVVFQLPLPPPQAYVLCALAAAQEINKAAAMIPIEKSLFMEVMGFVRLKNKKNHPLGLSPVLAMLAGFVCPGRFSPYYSAQSILI